MMNRLLRNLITILWIILSIYTILIAAFWVIYALPWFLVYETYTFYEGFQTSLLWILLTTATILLTKGTKHIIIELGVEPN